MAFAPRPAVMKRLLCGLTALVAATATQAADSGTYMLFDVGVNYMQNIHQESLGPPPSERDRKMDLGVRASIAEGIVLNRFLSVEVETGAMYNELDRSVDWLIQVPLLANVVFRYECKGGWTGFIGAGGGGALSMVNTSLGHDDTDHDFAFAWQGMAGIRYQFSQNLSLGLVYKYFGTSELEFSLFGGEFELDDIHNHSGGLQLTYSF